jgi:hypothetical protein
MKKLIVIIGACVALGGCVTAQKNYTFYRADGRSIQKSASLQKDLMVDATICQGETQRAAVGAPVVYWRGLAGAIAADMTIQRQRAALDDIARGCMAQRGYFVKEAPLGSPPFV